MTWQTILKARQSTLDEYEQGPLPTGARQSTLEEFETPETPEPSRKRRRVGPKETLAETRARIKGKKRSVDTGGDAASDVGEVIREARSKLMREARGPYGDLANQVVALALKAREEPREQKKLLGKIRKLIRKNNIVEVEV